MRRNRLLPCVKTDVAIKRAFQRKLPILFAAETNSRHCKPIDCQESLPPSQKKSVKKKMVGVARNFAVRYTKNDSRDRLRRRLRRSLRRSLVSAGLSHLVCSWS